MRAKMNLKAIFLIWEIFYPTVSDWVIEKMSNSELIIILGNKDASDTNIKKLRSKTEEQLNDMVKSKRNQMKKEGIIGGIQFMPEAGDLNEMKAFIQSIESQGDND